MAMHASFAQIERGFLADYLDFYPALGMRLGLHLYDGRADDYSPEAIAAWLRTLGIWERQLATLEREAVPPQQRLGAALIEQTIAHERFRWEVLRDHERNPLAASDLLDVTAYLKREYAPVHERLLALTSYLEDLPRSLDVARQHLREVLARPLIETAKDVLDGYLSFYATSLPQFAATINDPALRGRFEAALAAAGEAIRGFTAFLDGALGRAGDDFAIGEAHFAAMLRTGEMVDVPLARLIELGQAELARLTEMLRETARQIDPRADPREVMASLGRHHPPPETLIQETAALLEDLRRFLVERKIVSLPGEVRPFVQETPPFARWAFAMMDTAGPFEDVATESYYYVTPPEANWPPAQQEEWLSKFDYATLKDISIHEAYPGHFVHFMQIRQAPSTVSKVTASYSFAEGWAHYAEEMMLEAGVDPRPQFRLACLGEALVRQVRYLVAIRMHAADMTVEDATQMFQERAFMEPAPARKEAVRGTFDPGYLNYTLGKFMVRRLRDDYRAERGTAFSLREFHDRLLALGAPPIRLARRMLLRRDPGALL